MPGTRALMTTIVDIMAVDEDMAEVDDILKLPKHPLKQYMQKLRNQNQQQDVYFSNLRATTRYADFKAMEQSMYKLFPNTPQIFQDKPEYPLDGDKVAAIRQKTFQNWTVVPDVPWTWWLEHQGRANVDDSYFHREGYKYVARGLPWDNVGNTAPRRGNIIERDTQFRNDISLGLLQRRLYGIFMPDRTPRKQVWDGNPAPASSQPPAFVLEHRDGAHLVFHLESDDPRSDEAMFGIWFWDEELDEAIEDICELLELLVGVHSSHNVVDDALIPEKFLVPSIETEDGVWKSQLEI